MPLRTLPASRWSQRAAVTSTVWRTPLPAGCVPHPPCLRDETVLHAPHGAVHGASGPSEQLHVGLATRQGRTGQAGGSRGARCGLAAPARAQSDSFFENEVIVDMLQTLHTMVRFPWLWEPNCCFNLRKFGQILNIWVIPDLKSLEDEANRGPLERQASMPRAVPGHGASEGACGRKCPGQGPGRAARGGHSVFRSKEDVTRPAASQWPLSS